MEENNAIKIAPKRITAILAFLVFLLPIYVFFSFKGKMSFGDDWAEFYRPWMYRCCSALLIVAVSFLLYALLSKKSFVWSFIPLTTYVIFAWILGWRCIRLKLFEKELTGPSYLSWAVASITIGAFLFEVALVSLHIASLLQRKKNRALLIVSIGLTGLYVIFLLICEFCQHLFDDLIADNSIEIVFILLIVDGIVRNFAMLEPREKKHIEIQTPTVVTRDHLYFCPSCGARFAAGKKFCDQCGSALVELAQPETMEQNSYSAQDTSSTGIAILGFLVPLAGFFMWVSWNNSMPKKARSAGKGALIGAITYAVLSIVSVIIVLALF